MPTVNLGTSSLPVSTKQGETVTWQLPSPIAPNQHLRVEVKSSAEMIGERGSLNVNKVDLNMTFYRGAGKNVTLSYSAYLVTTTGTTVTEALLAPGPSLVIDTIGPPGGYPLCPGDMDEPGKDDHEHEEQD